MLIVNKYLNMEIDLEHLFEEYKIKIKLDDLIKKYNSVERFYHTFDHIIKLLKDIKIYDEKLIFAIVFHDIEFDVDISNYKEKSSQFFFENCDADIDFKLNVKEIILASKNIGPLEEPLKNEIIRVDRKILYTKDIRELLSWEQQIFKEYQKLSISEYKDKRASFLSLAYKETGNPTLLELRDIIKSKVYKIGFYPGSFNPFHVGHYNILLKAEKSFDKVVIGIGVNYEKKDIEKVGIPKIIKNREVKYYSGLITTAIEELNNDGEVFVVRGLRNAYDLQHEEGLRNVIKDFLPDQEFVYFFCNKEFEHISSTLIRDIQSRADQNVKSLKIIEKYCLE